MQPHPNTAFRLEMVKELDKSNHGKPPTQPSLSEWSPVIYVCTLLVNEQSAIQHLNVAVDLSCCFGAHIQMLFS